MTFSKKLAGLFLMASSLIACKSDSDDETNPSMEKDVKEFTLTIENVSKTFDYRASGLFNMPNGKSEIGVAKPEEMYEFSFYASPGDYLSFATMLVHTNDIFFAPSQKGIALFDNTKKALTGDITDQIMLWDAGTEVNQEPLKGSYQPARGKNQGMAENGLVKLVSDVNDGFTYPEVKKLVKAELSQDEQGMFTLKITNISKDSALESPIAPGVWAIHKADIYPLFEKGKADYGMGLEALAEEGDVMTLAENLKIKSGINNLLSPGIAVVHSSSTSPLFVENQMDLGKGLEALAEEGKPLVLNANLLGTTGISTSQVFVNPVGQVKSGAIASGQKYQIKFMASAGDKLSLATMLVQTNDLFYAFDDAIDLFVNGEKRTGDLTSEIELWDAGTEANEAFGFGLNQAPRQSKENMGETTKENIVEIDESTGRYPKNKDVIKITLQ